MIKCKKTLKTKYCIYTMELIKLLKMTNKSLFIGIERCLYIKCRVSKQYTKYDFICFGPLFLSIYENDCED